MQPTATNQQPPEPQVRLTHLEVVSVFDTIQGEGPFAGTPAIFVRLAGCNLQCPFCDTDYTSVRLCRSSKELAEQIFNLQVATGRERDEHPLAVLTGGEPFRQDIAELVTMLLLAGWKVQIETNGTLYYSLPWTHPRLCIVCSPKAPRIHLRLHGHITAMKYVVAHGRVDSMDGLPTQVLGAEHSIARPPAGFTGDIFIQPMDSGDPARNAQNLDAALYSCRSFGYRISLQLHKQLHLP